ncbi:MAG: LCP family protein [Patescibacteria group bacterium]
MREIKLNLLEDLEEKEKKEFREIFKESSRKKFIIKTIIILLMVSVLFFSRGLITEESLIKEMPKISFWKSMAKMIIFQEHLLKGEISDRINILVLGMGGAEHEGTYLTDTIILVSLKPSTNQLALLSIPRDLLVPIPGYGWRKINEAYLLGKMKEKNGERLAMLVVSNILNLPIHYFVAIDFTGFKEIIDALGGIEINVERSFTDHFFPAPNFQYRTVSFQKGWQTMDGRRALEFVRSRHGDNNESSDFARIKRQQKVILALKDKIKKIKILEERDKVWRLFNLLNKYFQTNLEFDEIIKLGRILSQISEEKIITKTLTIGEDSPLIEEISNGIYFLKTKTGTFKEIEEIAHKIFEEKPEKKLVKKSKIVLLNGTFIQGLAKSKIEILSENFEIVEIGNAPERNYQETVIYDLNKNNLRDLKILKEKLNGIVSEDIPPEFKDKEVDFVIVLGKK